MQYLLVFILSLLFFPVSTGFSHFGQYEDDESSLASSPTSSGPLSPKTPNASGKTLSQTSQSSKDGSHDHPSVVRERGREGGEGREGGREGRRCETSVYMTVSTNLLSHILNFYF